VEAHFPPCGNEVRSLRSGVTVASTQPFGQGLERVQVCLYHTDVFDVSRPRSLPSRAQDGFSSSGSMPLAHL
jgi:hypothetical protein